MSIWKLIYDLEYWLQIGTGADIVDAPDNRPEYQPLVKRALKLGIPRDKVPGKVLIALKNEADMNILFRSTFWSLLWLSIKRKLWRY